MVKNQTLDEHLKKWYAQWFPLSEQALGRAIDPREGGFYRFKDDDGYCCTYDPISLEN